MLLIDSLIHTKVALLTKAVIAICINIGRLASYLDNLQKYFSMSSYVDNRIYQKFKIRVRDLVYSLLCNHTLILATYYWLNYGCV